MKDSNVLWYIVAAILGGAGAVLGVVSKAWAVALVGAGVVVLALALVALL
jgi:hypothetical protein